MLVGTSMGSATDNPNLKTNRLADTFGNSDHQRFRIDDGIESVLGAYWAPVGCYWGSSGLLWEALGVSRKRIGPHWGGLGACPVRFGFHSVHLGDIGLIFDSSLLRNRCVVSRSSWGRC